VAEAAAPEEAQADGDTGKKQADRSKGKRNRKTFESLNFKKGVTIEVDVTENPG
jgi:hypothetical protein